MSAGPQAPRVRPAAEPVGWAIFTGEERVLALLLLFVAATMLSTLVPIPPWIRFFGAQLLTHATSPTDGCGEYVAPPEEASAAGAHRSAKASEVSVIARFFSMKEGLRKAPASRATIGGSPVCCKE